MGQLKDKSNEELLAMVLECDEYYQSAIIDELHNRGVSDDTITRPLLTLKERMRICESCQNHMNEIATNPESRPICGLTGKVPVFTGTDCDRYAVMPNYRNYLLKRALLGLAISLISLILGVFFLINHFREGLFALRDLLLIVLGIACLVVSIKYFIKRAKFKDDCKCI